MKSIDDATPEEWNALRKKHPTLQEAHEVVREVHSKINKDARIIWGASIDSTLEHQIRVMLVVTGVKSSQILGPPDGVDNGMQSKYGIDFVH